MDQVHRAAKLGFTAEAQTYSQGRPEYPAELLPWLADQLGAVRGNTVVDLGAGTGKFTQLLVRTAADVIAVEPVQAMRNQLSGKLAQVPVLEGTADAMPLDSASVDALVCAQSFHWFATEPALAEIHRVLKPGGKLGLVWNVRDESVDWVAAITEIITPYEGDTPRHYKGEWRKPFTGRYFSSLEKSSFPYQHVGAAREVIRDRFLSVSFIAALPPQEKTRVESQLQTLIDTHPALRGHATIAFPYRTDAYCCSSLALD